MPMQCSSRNWQPFMQLECSLQHAKTSPRDPDGATCTFSISSSFRPSIPNEHFYSGFQKSVSYERLLCYTAHPRQFLFLWSFCIWLKTINYESVHSFIFSAPFYFISHFVSKILHSSQFSKTVTYILPWWQQTKLHTHTNPRMRVQTPLWSPSSSIHEYLIITN